MPAGRGELGGADEAVRLRLIGPDEAVPDGLLARLDGQESGRVLVGLPHRPEGTGRDEGAEFGPDLRHPRLGPLLAEHVDDGLRLRLVGHERGDDERQEHGGSASDVQHHRPHHSIERTARNASCGTSTAPTCFIRFFPSFCFSRSFRFRLMSPP